MEKTFDFAKLIPLLIPIILVQVVLMVAALIDLSRQAKTRGLPKWGWALVIIFGELIGPIVYFLVGRKEE
jgi:hypothetical protein